MMTSFYYYDQNPSWFCFLVQIRSSVINLAGITKFKYERKNEKDSGRSSKTTPSCKWPITIKLLRFMLPLSQNTILKKKIELVFKIFRTVYCETDNINLSSLIKILTEKV